MPNLKQWRQSLGLSQVKAAQALGVSLRSYKRYEAGDIPKGIGKLLALACFYLSEKQD